MKAEAKFDLWGTTPHSLISQDQEPTAGAVPPGGGSAIGAELHITGPNHKGVNKIGSRERWGEAKPAQTDRGNY